MRFALVTIFLALTLMISACFKPSYISSETTPQPKGGIMNITESEPQKQSWILTGQEGVEDRVQFLTNLDDPSGKSFIRIDDMVDAMQTKADRIRFKGYWLNVGRVSDDGSRIAVLREQYDSGKAIIQLYDLNKSREEGEFELPSSATNLAISSDLEIYLYVIDGEIYRYDAVSKRTSMLKAGKEDSDLSGLQNGIFSPDDTKFLYLDDEPGIAILNLAGEQDHKRLLSDTNVTGLMKWNPKNEIYFTESKKSDTDNQEIYKLNLDNNKKTWISKDFDSSLLSEDESELVFLNDESKELVKDIGSGKIKDISSIVQNEGTWAVPYQWIDTNVDYMKYSNIVKVKEISASSTLVDPVYPNVSTNNLADNNNLTAWCEGVPGNGKGETITIDLGAVQKVRGLYFINGYNDTMQTFEENNSVKKMELEFSNGSTMELENYDSRTIFDEPVETSFIKITILEVNLGTKYPNTCVSEVKVL